MSRRPGEDPLLLRLHRAGKSDAGPALASGRHQGIPGGNSPLRRAVHQQRCAVLCRKIIEMKRASRNNKKMAPDSLSGAIFICLFFAALPHQPLPQQHHRHAQQQAQRRIQHRKAGLSALQQTCRLHGKGREGGEAAAHPPPEGTEAAAGSAWHTSPPAPRLGPAQRHLRY